MKKSPAILLSLIMTIAILSAGCFTAFAETTTKYWEPRPHPQDALGCINGEPGDVMSEWDQSTDTFTYSVDDKYHVVGWEFPLLTEGKDYKVIKEEGNSITIDLYTENNEIPYINALVETDKTTKANTNDNTTQSTTQNTTSSTTSAEKTELTTQETANTDLIQQSDSNTNKLIIICVAAVLVCVIIVGIVIKKKHNK